MVHNKVCIYPKNADGKSLKSISEGFACIPDNPHKKEDLTGLLPNKIDSIHSAHF